MLCPSPRVSSSRALFPSARDRHPGISGSSQWIRVRAKARSRNGPRLLAEVPSQPSGEVHAVSPVVLKRRTLLSRGGDVLGQQELHSVRAEPSTPGVRKQDVTSAAPRLPQPPFESVDGLLGQWGASLFSPFAHAAYVRAGSQHYI